MEIAEIYSNNFSAKNYVKSSFFIISCCHEIFFKGRINPSLSTLWELVHFQIGTKGIIHSHILPQKCLWQAVLPNIISEANWKLLIGGYNYTKLATLWVNYKPKNNTIRRNVLYSVTELAYPSHEYNLALLFFLSPPSKTEKILSFVLK